MEAQMPKLKTRPPKKSELQGNQTYLKSWDEYQKDRPGRTPILLPIIVGINSAGEIRRELMRAPKVASLARRLHKDLPGYMFNRNLTKHDPVAIFDDYIEYFDNHFKQGPTPEGPLDLTVKKPVWMLYYFDQKAWKFSKDIQFSTVNDPNDMTCNFVKIATMESNNALLMKNRFRCGPKGLKFNLHATITQKIDGRTMKTPIIIDPDQTNETNDDGETGGFGGWGDDGGD